MKISVITPSFNQVQFLPDNLRTVSRQTGVEVEHIIVDPGSTDGSTELARQAKHAILLNEPDRGQSHGITKGYAMATGDVLVWLNSDDYYPSDDVLSKVATAFEANPDADIIYGRVDFVDETGKLLRHGFVNRDSANLLHSFQYQVGIVQPGVFMRRKVFEAIGGPSEDYNYCMDYEYWVRIADAGFKWIYIDELLAHHRWWSGMKTSSGRGASLIEHFKVGLNYFGYIHHKWFDRYGEFMATSSDGVVNHATSVDQVEKRRHIREAIERFSTSNMMNHICRTPDKEPRETFEFICRQHPDYWRIEDALRKRIDDQTFFVVGNGPSLKPDLLDRLPPGRWIGMNAAYKYWDKKGIYPHFYACLDPVVVVQHKDAIQRMLAEKKIAEFFLHEEILTVLPALATDLRVTIRKDFVERANTLGFSPISTYKQTTGVLATRFCIERGFRNLCLIGIDCNYVEKISEATAINGLELVIDKDVGRNPNYFFDSYQEKSEKYQVPNPPVHSGNLHLQSFVTLRDDIDRSGKQIKVTVGSRESLLSKFNVFQYRDARALVGIRQVGAVAVPLIPSELDGFIDRLVLWLDPKLQPSFGGGTGTVLHLFIAGAETAEMRQKIDGAAQRLPWLGAFFSDLRVTFFDIAADVDYYVKGSALNVFCNTSGPNVFWLMIMAACRDYPYTFLMEADCLPVRPGWLEALDQATHDAPSGTWVIGANYSGPTLLAPMWVFHINGNALYATGDSAFQDYLTGDFLKALHWLVENVSNSVAYDVSFVLGMNNYRDMITAIGVDLRAYLRRYCVTPVIRNISGEAETEGRVSVDILRLVKEDSSLFLCHGVPALRQVVAGKDTLDSFFATRPGRITELNLHTFASLTNGVGLQNMGFGKVRPLLLGSGKDWPRTLRLRTGAMLGDCTTGRFELRLKAPTDVVLSTANVFAVAQSGGQTPISSTVSSRGDERIVTFEMLGTLQADKVMLDLTFDVAGEAADGVAAGVNGLRLLYLPEATPLTVTVLGNDAAAQAVCAAWREWIRAGQAALSARYRFLDGRNRKAMPALREVESTPQALFEVGEMRIPLASVTSTRFRFTTKPAPGATDDVALSLRLVSDLDCDIEILGEAVGVAKTIKRQMLVKHVPQVVDITFGMDLSKGRDFFVTLNSSVKGATSTAATAYLAIKQLHILKSPNERTEELVPVPAQSVETLTPRAEVPRLLVIDMTAIGNGTATGEIKSNLLADWPGAQLLQIAMGGQDSLAIVRRKGEGYPVEAATAEKVWAAITDFDPQVILYRPVPQTEVLHSLAMDLIKGTSRPLVTWFMDDWPARMAADAPGQWEKMDSDLRHLLSRSVVSLSISEDMSEAFEKRYKRPFQALANGIDPADWPVRRPIKREHFLIRYAGGIAPDMNRTSLLRCAEAIEELVRSGLKIRLEISTQPWWKTECEPLFARFPSTTLEVADKPLAGYRQWIAEADLLLIAYNFDEASLRYIRYSIANKMPECLASGVAVLAHGPSGIATIDYLQGAAVARMVTEPDVGALSTAIRALQKDSVVRHGLGMTGRQRAFERHNVHKLRTLLADIMFRVSTTQTGDSPAAVQMQASPPVPVTIQVQDSVAASAPSSDPAPKAPTAQFGVRHGVIVMLCSEILLGRKDPKTIEADPEMRALLQRATADLPAEDSALAHLLRVARFYHLDAGVPGKQ